MSTGHRGLSAPGLVALAGLLAFPGCVENRSSLTILQMQVPSEDCVVEATPDRFIPMGALEIGLIDDYITEYYMFPLLQNNLLSTASENDAERNFIEIIEARVNLDFGALGGALDADTARFRYPAFKTLAPGELAPVGVLAIPAVTARVLASMLPNPGDTVIVRARLKFLYQHGEYEHETHEIEFPIRVGRNILVTPSTNWVDCASGQVPDSPRGNPCYPMQDQVLDCCISNGFPVCPAVDMSASGT